MSKYARLTEIMKQAPMRASMRPRWRADEEELMRERYSFDGALALSKLLGRPLSSVRIKASEMGLRMLKKLKPTPAIRRPAVEINKAPLPPKALPIRATAKPKSKPPTAIAQMLEQMQKLGPTHPRCIAYTQAARTGTGQDALTAWATWQPAPHDS